MVLYVRHQIKNWNIIPNSVIFKENIEMNFNFFYDTKRLCRNIQSR